MRTIFWHNRWSGAVPHVSNRMKRPNFQNRDRIHSVSGCKNIHCFGVCFWGVWEKEFLYVVAKLRAKSQKPWKISLSYSLAVGMGHFDMLRWEYDSVCIFSMLQDTLDLSLWKKADEKCKDKKRRIFFAKGALLGKSTFPTQRINAVHGRWSSSGVLHDIPTNFTLSVRRRIVLQF